jgi:hypothetical protein
VDCLSRIIIETIYVNQESDVDLINSLNTYNYPSYTHPCPNTINTHGCARSLSRILGNGEFIGYSNLNNTDLTDICDDVTSDGVLIYQDNENTYIGQSYSSWVQSGGDSETRYNNLSIDLETALLIAENTQSGTSYIDFTISYVLDEVNVECPSSAGVDNTVPHEDLTWVRVIREEDDGSFDLLYNGCPSNNIVTVDVCQNVGGTDPEPTPTPNPEDPFTTDCDYVTTHFPATLNGVDVTVEMTGDAFPNTGSLNVCYNPIDFSSIPTGYYNYRVGVSDSFTITFNFSTPVNNVKFKLTGAGQVNNPTGNETFIITTNSGGTPSIVSPLNCFTTINGNIIVSGAGYANNYCPSCDGGGGLFIVNNNTPYTSFTISGPGGLQGSIVSLCGNFTINQSI